MSVTAVVNNRKPSLLLSILAKLTLTGAVCLFMELYVNTLTYLCLFYEHRHNICKFPYLSFTTDTVQQMWLETPKSVTESGECRMSHHKI